MRPPGRTRAASAGASRRSGLVRMLATTTSKASDPRAASIANARANGVDAEFVLPESLAAREWDAFDVVVANILTNPLRLLAPALAARVRPGGRIVLSGILEAQADEVVAIYADWFNIGVWRADEGWVALAGTRRGAAPDAALGV